MSLIQTVQDASSPLCCCQHCSALADIYQLFDMTCPLPWKHKCLQVEPMHWSRWQIVHTPQAQVKKVDSSLPDASPSSAFRFAFWGGASWCHQLWRCTLGIRDPASGSSSWCSYLPTAAARASCSAEGAGCCCLCPALIVAVDQLRRFERLCAVHRADLGIGVACKRRRPAFGS